VLPKNFGIVEWLKQLIKYISDGGRCNCGKCQGRGIEITEEKGCCNFVYGYWRRPV
jgi:hypothetical protein